MDSLEFIQIVSKKVEDLLPFNGVIFLVAYPNYSAEDKG